MDCSPPARLHCQWDFPGKSLGVGCHFLLQRIFQTQGLNLSLSMQLLHWQVNSLPLSHLGSLTDHAASYNSCISIVLPLNDSLHGNKADVLYPPKQAHNRH